MAHVHFHDIRHSTASLMAHNGTDLLTVNRILGHSTTKMSERYAHIQADKQRDALKKAFGGENLLPKSNLCENYTGIYTGRIRVKLIFVAKPHGIWWTVLGLNQ